MADAGWAVKVRLQRVGALAASWGLMASVLEIRLAKLDQRRRTIEKDREEIGALLKRPDSASLPVFSAALRKLAKLSGEEGALEHEAAKLRRDILAVRLREELSTSFAQRLRRAADRSTETDSTLELLATWQGPASGKRIVFD